MSATLESLVDLTDPAAVAAEIGRMSMLLAGRADVPDEAWQLVTRINDAILGGRATAKWQAIDSYLLEIFMRGLAQVNSAASRKTDPEARRSLRLGFERMRHALEEIAGASPISEERSPKDVVRWLAKTIPVSQQELANVLGVERRKLQRWLNESSSPEGDDALRVAAVARVVNQLRHAFTPIGVLRWFDRPRRELGGRKPKALLTNVEKLPRLVTLAASARHSDSA
jgi:transcriptional regulator with XRE-family HTH domain